MLEEIQNRHAVRKYQKRKLPDELAKSLNDEIACCNQEGELNIQLVLNEEQAFQGFFTTFGRFQNVSNYIALVGEDNSTLDERAGYYGERLVLLIQKLGLNSCWVSGSYNKKKNGVRINEGQRLVCVIAFGYGATQGKEHKSKPLEQLYVADGPIPDWFEQGMKAAQLAPTSYNKQNFLVILNGDHVKIQSTVAPQGMISIGIVKYHFELGSGRKIRV